GSNTTLRNHITHPHCEVIKAQKNQNLKSRQTSMARDGSVFRLCFTTYNHKLFHKLFRHILWRRSDNGVHQFYKKCTKNCAASVHQHSLDGCQVRNVHDKWSWRSLHQGINHTRYQKDLLLEVLPLAHGKIPGFDLTPANQTLQSFCILRVERTMCVDELRGGGGTLGGGDNKEFRYPLVEGDDKRVGDFCG
nr:hypothetical protein [Tanacetum cinerariifolium]